jgi:hypothetical protein
MLPFSERVIADMQVHYTPNDGQEQYASPSIQLTTTAKSDPNKTHITFNAVEGSEKLLISIDQKDSNASQTHLFLNNDQAKALLYSLQAIILR